MSEKSKIKEPPKEFISDEEIHYRNTHWKEVLDEIYNRVPNAFGPGKFKHQDKNPIAKKLKITDQELYNNAVYLHQNGLIEIKNEGTWTNMYPTSKGFDIAFQNEKMKTDLKIQRSIMGLTAIIALTAVFSFLISTGKYESYIMGEILVMLYVFGLAMIYFIPNRKKFFPLKRT